MDGKKQESFCRQKSHSNALVTQKGFACEMVARANYSYHRLPKSDFWVCPHFSKTPLTSFFACSIIDFQLKKVSLVKMAFDKKKLVVTTIIRVAFKLNTS